MAHLSRVQRRILALLEEAGELELVSMINTVAYPKGDPREISAMQDALGGLYDHGYITLSCWLRPLSKTIELKSEDVHKLLGRLTHLVVWSPETGFWKATPRTPFYNIEVTDHGYETACEILEEEGYPNEPLSAYE